MSDVHPGKPPPDVGQGRIVASLDMSDVDKDVNDVDNDAAEEKKKDDDDDEAESLQSNWKVTGPRGRKKGAVPLSDSLCRIPSPLPCVSLTSLLRLSWDAVGSSCVCGEQGEDGREQEWCQWR